MKILHSADWHLDSPFLGMSEERAKYLRQELLKIPEQIAEICRRENCDMLLLAGDLFDGDYTQESFRTVSRVLGELGIPVFITPGNHDYCTPRSPYLAEIWPENVHIFKTPVIEAVELPQLDCKIYGAGYIGIDCKGLLKGFRAEGLQKWHIGILHGDAVNSKSNYCPITAAQIRSSGLTYLALGHTHKGDQSRAGDTLYAWPGCPMGRALDECGEKGVLLVTMEDTVSAEFLPLNGPRFYDIALDAGENPAETIANALPAAETPDTYRITLTGYAAPIDLKAIAAAFPHVPYLELRDHTLPEIDLWGCIDDDSLEGVFFRKLHDGLDTDSEKLQRQIRLAAKISRQILDGQEVILP